VRPSQVLEAFADKTAALPEGDLRVALTLLRNLMRWPRSSATGRGSWSTAASPLPRSKAITREVNTLCRKLRPLAVDLVDAYGVPPELLRSPDLL
jgi:acyl-CoA oxidase